jgi:glycerate kinase
MHVLAAPDKFRGTATAPEAARAMAAAAQRCGATVTMIPMADGGEGTLDAFGGANQSELVTGPLGAPVEAAWRFDAGTATAVIESSTACGLQIAGGVAGNDAEAATTRGVGELIGAAVRQGARRIVVGIGGSATTDGGLAAVEALTERGLRSALRDVDLLVCCDVRTRFLDAARVFAPQKGAGPEAVERLTERLAVLRRRYVEQFGVDPHELVGSGGAGGLAGGLAAIGARLVPGVDVIATEVGLDDAIRHADVVVTGEGRLDRTSLQGKVVGAVCERARTAGRPVIVVAGGADPDVRIASADVVSLTVAFGKLRALTDTVAAIEDATILALERLETTP